MLGIKIRFGTIEDHHRLTPPTSSADSDKKGISTRATLHRNKEFDMNLR